jgi:hypothetical protein
MASSSPSWPRGGRKAASSRTHQVTKLLDEEKTDVDSAGLPAPGARGSPGKLIPSPAAINGQVLRDFAGSTTGSRDGRAKRLGGSYRGKLSKNMVMPIKAPSGWKMNLG